MALRLLVITLGGAVGTCLRALIETALPPAAGGWPWATFVINVSGSLLLGLLLETLVRRGPDAGIHRLVRLGVGTGVLGGYTTYSTFAVEVSERTTSGSPVIGVSYAVASVVLGVLAAAAGFRLAVLLDGRDGRTLAPTSVEGDTE